MGSNLRFGKLILLLASTAMAGAIHYEAQAAAEIDCNSGLTQIALASQEGSEGGTWKSYEHCVRGAKQAQRMTSEFVGTGERASGSQPGAAVRHAWPDQSGVRD